MPESVIVQTVVAGTYPQAKYGAFTLRFLDPYKANLSPEKQFKAFNKNISMFSKHDMQGPALSPDQITAKPW